MGLKLGVRYSPLGEGAWSPSNTTWSWPRPTCMPSFIMIHPTIWPQYSNITDRQTNQTDRQQSDSIRRTVYKTVRPVLWDLCLSCLSVSAQATLCLMATQLPLKGAQPLPNFRPMSTVPNWSPISATAEHLYKRLPKNQM